MWKNLQREERLLIKLSSLSSLWSCTFVILYQEVFDMGIDIHFNIDTPVLPVGLNRVIKGF